MRAMKLDVHRDASGEWRWTLTAANGVMVDSANEGFKNEAYATKVGIRVAIGWGRPFVLTVGGKVVDVATQNDLDAGPT